MFRIKSCLIAQVLSALAFGCCVSPAQIVVAHRGVFHDVNSPRYSYAENSYTSAINALTLGIKDIEFDLRLSHDGYIMVTHDLITNRTTGLDNDQGFMDPVKIYRGEQPSKEAVPVNFFDKWELAGQRLKVYGNNDQLRYSPDDNMAELGTMLDALDSSGLFGKGFHVFLDIQDPTVFERAAYIVSAKPYKRNIFLKFFVSRALFNKTRYNGSDTCYAYMKAHHLDDRFLNIVPQINDGQLDINEDDDVGIKAFGTTLPIGKYLDCWRDAHNNHPNNTAYMPIVSASVPSSHIAAEAGASAALGWARSNRRKTMSVVPNPDVGVAHGGCFTYSFQAFSVSAKQFDEIGRYTKAQFAKSQNVDYLIIDVMGDRDNRTYYTDPDRFDGNLCTGQ